MFSRTLKMKKKKNKTQHLYTNNMELQDKRKFHFLTYL